MRFAGGERRNAGTSLVPVRWVCWRQAPKKDFWTSGALWAGCAVAAGQARGSVERVYVAREVHDRFQILKESPMEAKTRETLKSLRVTTIRSIRQAVATLSGGQRQSVAVARAVMWNSRLVILDEPTAALGVAQTEQVLALVNRLAEQGLSVVLISHNLHDVFETATRIAVLRLGRNVGVYERAKSTQEEIVHAITAGAPTKVSGIPGTSTATQVTA